MSTLADTLRLLMKSRKVSVRKLAHATGLSPGTIQRLVSGSGVPRQGSIQKLSEFFEVDLEESTHSQKELELHSDSVRVSLPAIKHPIVPLELLPRYLSGDTEHPGYTLTQWPIGVETPSSPFACCTTCWTDAMSPFLRSGDLLYLSTCQSPKRDEIAIGLSTDKLFIGRFARRSPTEALLIPSNTQVAGTNAQPIEQVLAVVVGFFRKL